MAKKANLPTHEILEALREVNLWNLLPSIRTCLLLLCASEAYAQGGTTGAISGLLTDSQGALIPRAQVQATQVPTGVITKTVTKDAGVYTFPYLQFGQYEVRFRANGMREAIVSAIRIDVGNISRVDGRLVQLMSGWHCTSTKNASLRYPSKPDCN